MTRITGLTEEAAMMKTAAKDVHVNQNIVQRVSQRPKVIVAQARQECISQLHKVQGGNPRLVRCSQHLQQTNRGPFIICSNISNTQLPVVTQDGHACSCHPGCISARRSKRLEACTYPFHAQPEGGPHHFYLCLIHQNLAAKVTGKCIYYCGWPCAPEEVRTGVNIKKPLFYVHTRHLF